ncbi:MAG: hypothetical protein AB1629_04495 [Candidatus Omnitrophota bacterium]
MRKISTFSLTALLLIIICQVGTAFALGNFQLKRRTIVPGAGSSFKYGIHQLVQIIGETIGGESSSSANFSLSSGYFSYPETIPTPELTIVSISPANLTKIYQSQGILIEVKANGGDTPSFQYQFNIDSQLKQDWNTSNIYSWQISTSEIGKSHQIEAMVKDSLGRQASAQSKIFILHKPIEPPARSSPRRCGGKGQPPCPKY